MLTAWICRVTKVSNGWKFEAHHNEGCCPFSMRTESFLFAKVAALRWIEYVQENGCEPFQAGAPSSNEP